MKKVLSLVLALVMALSLCTSAWATSEETSESTGATAGTETGGTGANGTEGGKTSSEENGGQATTCVAETGSKQYVTLQEAIDAAGRKATVTMLADTRENVTISTNDLTLDLNGHTLNGSTGERKPALTITARVTVKDSSEGQTGTIMREDTAENSGVSSHYVIDVQGSGWLTFESGIVTNNSGNTAGKGASLVRVGDDSVAKYPGLNIKGGTFTQDNFIVIKVDSGDLFLNGGTLNSANSYAIEDWHRATIKGGTVNGAVAAWTYNGGHNSDLTISGGTVNGDVYSVNYGSAEGKKATVTITGGTVNGELDTRSYDPATGDLTSINDAAKATIKVTGGTFSGNVSDYVPDNTPVATVSTQGGGNTYVVGSEAIADAANNDANVTIIKGGAISGVNEGVTIVVDKEVKGVTINNVPVEENKTYIVPAKPSTGGYYYYPSTPGITAELNGTNKSATDYPGGDYGLVFRSTAAFSTFQGVQVDGKTLAKSNSTAEEGSTVVYLKAAYLKTLAAGKHTITILSTAGNTSMDFTIGGKSSSPQTFDAGMGIYAVTAVLSVTGMAWTAKKRH